MSDQNEDVKTENETVPEDELEQLPVESRAKAWFFLKISKFIFMFTALIIVAGLVEMQVITGDVFKDIFLTVIGLYCGANIYSKFIKK